MNMEMLVHPNKIDILYIYMKFNVAKSLNMKLQLFSFKIFYFICFSTQLHNLLKKYPKM